MRWLLLIALFAGCRREEHPRPDRAAAAAADVNLIVLVDPRYLAKHDVTRAQVLAALQKANVAVRKVSEREAEIEILTHAPETTDMSELLKTPLKEGVELGHVASLQGRPLAK